MLFLINKQSQTHIQYIRIQKNVYIIIHKSSFINIYIFLMNKLVFTLIVVSFISGVASFNIQEYNPLIVLSDSEKFPQYANVDQIIQILKKSTESFCYFNLVIDAQDFEYVKRSLLGIGKNSKFSSLISGASEKKLQQYIREHVAKDNVYKQVGNITILPENNSYFELEYAGLINSEKLLKQSSNGKTLIFNVNFVSVKRILAATPNATNNSTVLTYMYSNNLSGILVSLFLIVMLLIALACLMNLKTNDKFARNQLAVGKES